MSEIVLKRANVVKCVDSEEKALELELKGFVRVEARMTKKSKDADKK